MYQYHSYLLTPWCRVLLEKLTLLQLVKKFTAFHGTRRFITALTSVRHMSLTWDSPIQSIYPHPTSWRSILILSTHLRLCLPCGLFPSCFPTKAPIYICCRNSGGRVYSFVRCDVTYLVISYMFAGRQQCAFCFLVSSSPVQCALKPLWR